MVYFTRRDKGNKTYFSKFKIAWKNALLESFVLTFAERAQIYIDIFIVLRFAHH